LNFQVYTKDVIARMLVEHIKRTHSAEANLQPPNEKKRLYRKICQIMNFFMIHSYSGLERNANLFVKHWNERQLHAGRH